MISAVLRGNGNDLSFQNSRPKGEGGWLRCMDDGWSIGRGGGGWNLSVPLFLSVFLTVYHYLSICLPLSLPVNRSSTKMNQEGAFNSAQFGSLSVPQKMTDQNGDDTIIEADFYSYSHLDLGVDIFMGVQQPGTKLRPSQSAEEQDSKRQNPTPKWSAIFWGHSCGFFQQ